LTCDLWAENGERKMMAGATILDSVSWFFFVALIMKKIERSGR
jgi:hypothetical protein